MKTKLDMQTYLNAFKDYNIGITGGTLSDFLRQSRVNYYGGKCAIYQVEYYHTNGERVVIGGNYATNGKPELKALETLDF